MNRKIELNKVVANRLYNEPNQFKVVILSVLFFLDVRSLNPEIDEIINFLIALHEIKVKQLYK